MTVRNPPVRRRPRRSNSLKDIGRLLGIAGTAYEESRQDRLLAKVRQLSDTDGNAHSNYFVAQTANLFLRQFGIQLIANDRVLHVYEEWPGMDRRKISGSVYKHTKLFFLSGGIGAAWLDDGPAGDVLRHLKAQALDRGAPAALAKQGGTGRGCAQLGGATAQEKRLATLSRARENDAIVALRDADAAFVATCDDAEELNLKRADLMSRTPGHDWQAPWQEVVASAAVSEVNRSELMVKVKKTAVLGVYDRTPGGNSKRFNPLGLDAAEDYEPWGEDGDG